MSPFSSVCCRKTFLRFCSGHMSCILAHGFIHAFFLQSRFLANCIPTVCITNVLMKVAVRIPLLFPTPTLFHNKILDCYFLSHLGSRCYGCLWSPVHYMTFQCCVYLAEVKVKPILIALQLCAATKMKGAAL